MQTLCLAANEESIRRAAGIIRDGGVVAFPTETVYGLGANALDAHAVLGIFAAKERPADNPLIVHIADAGDMAALCCADERAGKLAQAFWPGPLTMICKKKPLVPDVVTAGLDSVAVRMPAHPVARRLIEAAGVPIAAPSANRSGRPSPTRAAHVWDDMAGRIPLILDGGACSVGLESTVVLLTGDTPTVLRPGGVTPEAIAAVLGGVRVADSVMRPLSAGESAPSPGMKHRHYAPRADMTLFVGECMAVAARIKACYDQTPGAVILAPSAHIPLYGGRRVYDLGENESDAARRLFCALRWADEVNAAHIYCEGYPESGVGLAVMNRMARAADFRIVAV